MALKKIIMETLFKNYRPGVLSKEQLIYLCKNNIIDNVKNPEKDCGLSAIDLSLSNIAYEMINGSIKPSKEPYNKYFKEKKLTKALLPDADNIFYLHRKNTYLFKLRERLQIPKDCNLYGQATAKSTIGRIDVLARLIVDGMDSYEYFDTEKVTSGDLYLEITPITFDVRVKEGISLSQLRLFYGNIEYSTIGTKELKLYGENILSNDSGTLSVDLKKINIKDGLETSAFRAKGESKALDLWERDKYNPYDYWELIDSDEHNRLKIESGAFYILRSKENIMLPPTVAVYCRAMDETIGEMRIHYAGFVHPTFGMNRRDKEQGTPLIFEVRGHNVNVNLLDNEIMAKLTFYRMSKDAKEPMEEDNKYNEQTLKLSKLFSNW